MDGQLTLFVLLFKFKSDEDFSLLESLSDFIKLILIVAHCCLSSTLQEVAVFVFDKKMIDKYQKFEKDQIIDSLKRGVQQLTRLRHPRLLTVQHPLEESR